MADYAPEAYLVALEIDESSDDTGLGDSMRDLDAQLAALEFDRPQQHQPATVAELQAECSEWRRRCTAAEERLAAMDTKVARLVLSVRSERERTQAELRQALDRAAEADRARSGLEDKLRRLLQVAQAQRVEMTEQQTRVHALEDRLAEKSRLCEALEGKLQRLVEAVKAQRQQQQQQQSQQQSQAGVDDARVAELEGRVLELEGKLLEAQTTIRDLVQKLREERSITETIESKTTRLVEAVKKERERTTQRIADLQGVHEVAREKAERFEREVNQHANRERQLRERLGDMELKLKQTVDRANRRLEGDGLLSPRGGAAGAAAAGDAGSKAAQETIADLRRRIEDLEAGKKELGVRVSAAEERAKAAEDERVKAQQRADREKEKNTMLRSVMMEKEEELTSMVAVLEESVAAGIASPDKTGNGSAEGKGGGAAAVRKEAAVRRGSVSGRAGAGKSWANLAQFMP